METKFVFLYFISNFSNQAPLNQGQDIQMTNNKQVLTTYESPRRGNSKKSVNQGQDKLQLFYSFD